jgi:dTDP-4-amino-4,6-dideoxygalactose transaminase
MTAPETHPKGPSESPQTRPDPGRIPQTQPDITELETGYVQQALESGWLAGGGPFATRAAAQLTAALGCSDVVLTTSGTDALELAALLLDVGPGDNVVLPSFTFASVATAFARTGARIRFADIERETLGIDPVSLAGQMDDSVRAVVPVHYGGMAFDLTGVLGAIERFERTQLVEDNAHGLFGTYEGKPLGTFGPVGATSFHATKNLVAGEGGALLINEPSLVKRAHVLADKGTDRQAFLQGTVDKYTWRDTGSSFILAEPLAALLTAQLERRDEIHAKRAALYDRYSTLLTPESKAGRFDLPGSREGCEPVRHLFYVLVESETVRDLVAADMQAEGIVATFHYLPLHAAPAAARFSDSPAHCPVADDVSRRLLRLPFHTGVDIEGAERVVEAFLRALERHG